MSALITLTVIFFGSCLFISTAMMHLPLRQQPLPNACRIPLAFPAKIHKPIDQSHQECPAKHVTDRHQRMITDREQTVGRALFIPLQNQLAPHVPQFRFIFRVEFVPFNRFHPHGGYLVLRAL